MSYPFSPTSWSLVLSELPVQLPQLIPEEQRQDGVRAEPEIRRSQALVESHQALLPQRLGKAVGEAFVELPLEDQIRRSAINSSEPSDYTQLQIPNCP